MRLTFDIPQPIEKLRKQYNHKVSYITSVDQFPLVSAIEFPGDYHSALRKRSVPVKLSKKLDREIAKYRQELSAIWDKHQAEIIDAAKAAKLNKAEGDDEVKQKVNILVNKLKKVAPAAFATAYLLGKQRGQILTNQEVDDTLTDQDQANLAEKEAWNDGFLDNLSDDLYAKYQDIDPDAYDSPEELQAALEKTQNGEQYRLGLFAAAAGSVLLALGMGQAMKDVQQLDDTGEPTGEPLTDPDTDVPLGDAYEGGFWHTSHDNEVCEGCDSNDGFWMLVDDFMIEAGRNECHNNCRCAELFEPADRPDDDSLIWEGTAGADLPEPKWMRDIQEQNQKVAKGGVGSGSWEGPGQPRFAWSGQPTVRSGQDTHITEEDRKILVNVLENTEPQLISKMAEAKEKIRFGTPVKDKFFNDETHSYVPQRQALHSQIIKTYLDKVETSTNPTFIMAGGLPGSGKSSILEQDDYTKFIHVDSDEIKGLLPEYQGWNAALLQTEADDIIGQIFQQAVAENKNILFDGTMKSQSKYEKLANHFSTIGYKVGAVFAKLPLEKAMKRAITRFDKTGRFVDPAYIASHDAKNEKTFDSLKTHLDFYKFYNTDVPRGTKPNLIEAKNG